MEKSKNKNVIDTVEADLVLEYVEGQGLRLKLNEIWIWVKAKANFPWSYPHQYISLVNLEGEEVQLIGDLKDCSEADRVSIEKGLLESRFCFEINKIEEIQERLDLREWSVETTSGSRVFHTKTSHWPTVLESGQVFVQDLFGDIYRIENPTLLDEESQNFLSSFADF